MKKFFLFAAISIIALSGCTKLVRYSPDEIKGFSPAIQDHIKRGEVVTGMTPQQVRFAWGSPNEVNVLEPSEEKKYREEWVYTRKIGIFKTRLIFTDGKLTEIVTTEPGIIRK